MKVYLNISQYLTCTFFQLTKFKFHISIRGISKAPCPLTSIDFLRPGKMTAAIKLVL